MPEERHPDPTRAALNDLALAAGPFLREDRRHGRRGRLLGAIERANAALALPAPYAIDPRNPEDLIAAWLAAGGRWHDLAAAVNRAGERGAGLQPERTDA